MADTDRSSKADPDNKVEVGNDSEDPYLLNTESLSKVEIVEISIDGMCGVY